MERLSDRAKKDLINSYFAGARRLILLDYDGTLVPFEERPESAKPDSELVSLLEALCGSEQNEVVIISGRDRDILEKWLGGFVVGLIAEHGAWVRDIGGTWEVVGQLKSDWKERARPVLELYAEKTPGSFVEEKEFSLVWHFRQAEPETASAQARELKRALSQLALDHEIGVLDGNKIVEVKNVSVNKGRAALRWLSKEIWSFILAVGDDVTDEDLFAVVPQSGYSIKVGPGISHARFNLDCVAEVRTMLRELVSS